MLLNSFVGTCGVGGGAASTLLTGLTAYYALENANDSLGTNNLTNHGSVAFAAGKVSNAATFVSSSSKYLECADAVAFQMGTGNLSLALWAKFSTSSNQNICVCGNTGGRGYGIQNNAGGIVGGISDNSNNAFTTAIHSFNDNGWHLAIITCDRAGNMICYVDNTLESSVSITPVSASVSNAVGFQIGAMQASGFFDGSVDECGLWSKLLTTTERGSLWNGGTGVTYPFTGSP